MTLSLAKNKIKILLLEGIHNDAKEYFEDHGYSQVELVKIALEHNELLEKIKGVHMVGIRSRTQLVKEVFEADDKLMAIGTYCIGTNQVDLESAEMNGVPVFNAPFSNTRSVAEMVVAEAVMLMRGISEKNVKAHKGEWQKSAVNSNEVRGKRIGIIGYGHIGTQVGVLAEAFGMEVFYYDTIDKLFMGNAKSVASLEALLSSVDVATLHVPGTELTENMIGEKEIAMMKEGSYLINASRGNVVDISALAKALREKRLFGAAIDVHPVEPKSKEDEFVSELRSMDNVILTPHIGGSTLEAQRNIAREVSDKLIKYSDIGSTVGATNFPEVALPQQIGKKRFLHIHANQPGVMRGINKEFSKRKLNIAGQHLMTDNNIGYVVFDIDDDNIDTELINDLKNIEGTIRVRMLY